ncbi:MAG: hypothetical protein LUF92_04895, partial [Clostridiales bacterium]|nr:hypothetical protein [Clostridiales bacterium]
LKSLEDDMREEYEKVITEQVKEVAASFFMEVDDVRISWDAEGNGIRKMEIAGECMEEQEDTPDVSSLRMILMDYYDLEAEDITIEVGK